MKRNSLRIGAVVAIVGVAVVAGWQIYRGRAPEAADAKGNHPDAASRDAAAAAETGQPLTLVAAESAEPTVPPMVTTDQEDRRSSNPFASGMPVGTEESGRLPVAASDRYATTETPPPSRFSPVEPNDVNADEEMVARGQNEGRDSYDQISEPNPLRGLSGNAPGNPPRPATGTDLPPQATGLPLNEESPTPAQLPQQSFPTAREPAALPDGLSDAEPLASAAMPVRPAAHGERYGGSSPTPSAAVGFGQRNAPLQNRPALNPIPQQARGEPAPLRGSPLDVAPPTSQLPVAPQVASRQEPPIPGRSPTAAHVQGRDGAGRPGEQSLEGPQSPSLVVEKLAPKEIQVGKQCTFEVRVRNVGQSAAHQVQIFDEVPQGTQLVGTSPCADQGNSGRLVWEIGTLSAGEEKTVEVQLMPTDEGDLGSVATVTFASEASVRTRSTRPLLEVRTTAGRQVMIGDEHVITVEIHNPGSGDATGVMLLENIPQGVTHPSGPSLEFEVGTLRAGETRKLELVLAAEEAGMVQNRLVARADANLQAEDTIEFEVIAPNLRVSITGPRRRYLERQATYSVAVDNPGTAAAKDIELETKLPKGMQFVKANNLGEYDSATHSVHWSLAELPPNERGAVELVMIPVEPGEHRVQVASHARDGLEDQTEHSVVVEGLAAIMFEVIDVDDPIEVGGETTYEIRVVNQGSKAATNVQVGGFLPPGMTVTAASGPTEHQLGQGQVVFAPLRKLAPKADTTFQVTVQGMQPGDQRFTVRVTTAEHQDPITKEESTRVYTDE